jgi:hypothetical protein
LFGLPANYHSPQPEGSLGRQEGTATAVDVVRTGVVDAEVVRVWALATAPVRARATTKARTMFFMG